MHALSPVDHRQKPRRKQAIHQCCTSRRAKQSGKILCEKACEIADHGPTPQWVGAGPDASSE